MLCCFPMPQHALQDHAADSLAFIRATMARSAAFTAVPGRGGIVMGIVGLTAILTAALVRTDRFDLLPATWLLLYGAGILASATASVAILTWLGVGLMALG